MAVVSLETGEQRTLLTDGSSAVYLKTGHLLYLSGDDLLAAPFELGTLA